MTTAADKFPDQKGRTARVSRVIDAPRALVFEAMTKPVHLVHWHHAGDGWTTPFAEADVRPGGAMRVGYASPDGKESFVLEGTYRDAAAGLERTPRQPHEPSREGVAEARPALPVAGLVA